MIRIRTIAFALTALLAAGFAVTAQAQEDDADIVVRLNQLQNQIRQLTGSIEQLQFRNQQLEQQLKRMQDDTEFRFQELSGKGGARPAQQARPGQIQQPPQAAANPPPAAPLPPPQQQQGGRGDGRGDAFDPGANPGAPGAPRTLGAPGRRSDVAQPTGAVASAVASNDAIGTQITGQERQPGGYQDNRGSAPLDLSGGGGGYGQRQPQGYPPQQQSYPPQQQQGYQQPQAYPQNNTVVASAPPPPPAPATPRDEYNAAYSFIQRKDYAGAEENLRGFIARHPKDRLAGDAQFWLGESLFQRKNYREASEAFVVMSKKYDKSAKAPEALLRLGQSLAALNEKELSCATFSEVERKYPKASKSVKDTIDREQKRGHC